MIILWIEMLVVICLIIAEIIMLQRMKKRNENWWRTYWARETIMLQKLKEIDERTIEILNNVDY